MESLSHPWLLWVLWTSRNQFLFEDKSFSETEMLTKAIRAGKEWQESLPPRKQNSVSNKDNVVSNSHYQVPEVASILYSDAAWNASSLAGGLGWICTNSAGSYRFQGTETKRYIASALAAEALALLAGLSKAAFSGIKDVICLSDSKSLIDIITGNKAVVAIRGILHDIGVLSASFNSISFRFISRVCNEPADRLAKNALFQLSNSLSEIASTDEL